MAATKTPKRRATSRPMKAEPWREAVRRRLAKVPEVDAVFVRQENGTVHVYSVVEDFDEAYYARLLKQEDLIEKAAPKVAFEFHTWVHQGRNPSESGPPFSELVFLR